MLLDDVFNPGEEFKQRLWFRPLFQWYVLMGSVIRMDVPFTGYQIHAEDALSSINKGKIKGAGQFSAKNLNEGFVPHSQPRRDSGLGSLNDFDRLNEPSSFGCLMSFAKDVLLAISHRLCAIPRVFVVSFLSR